MVTIINPRHLHSILGRENDSDEYDEDNTTDILCYRIMITRDKIL